MPSGLRLQAVQMALACRSCLAEARCREKVREEWKERSVPMTPTVRRAEGQPRSAPTSGPHPICPDPLGYKGLRGVGRWHRVRPSPLTVGSCIHLYLGITAVSQSRFYWAGQKIHLALSTNKRHIFNFHQELCWTTYSLTERTIWPIQ